MAGVMGHFINTILYWKSHIQGFNAIVNVGDNESAESALRRFRKAVMSSNVIIEARRRRYHETTQDIKKRKKQNSIRNRRDRNKPRTYQQKLAESNLQRVRVRGGADGGRVPGVESAAAAAASALESSQAASAASAVATGVTPMEPLAIALI